MTADLHLPLTTHQSPEDIIAVRPAGTVTVAQFLADVKHVASLLPTGISMLNLCEDRYHFMVGFAAGLLAENTSLLPSSHTPETIRQLLDFSPDLFCLHDGKGPGINLPSIEFPPQRSKPDPDTTIPVIPADRIVGYLFTSGSTGSPVPHRKSWGKLVKNGQSEAERLGFSTRGPSIVGTVPAQHSYGLESTILLTLHGKCRLWAGRPFYPADIAAALAVVPEPRMLVTTPYHLRTLLDSAIPLPKLDCVLSATAPLSQALAEQAEQQLAAPLLEIYGCTETGQLASRRTNASPAWQLLPGIRLEQTQDITFASGGHVEERTPLSDVIELLERDTFLLQGRHADLINIAGKRTSLTYLNQQLNAIKGVTDGCFFMPDTDENTPVESITRLMAFVVAPNLSKRQIVDALRDRIDPIFLPRPLHMVEYLPRNTTGKLPRSALLALAGSLPKASGK